jgi:hypothetical protein
MHSELQSLDPVQTESCREGGREGGREEGREGGGEGGMGGEAGRLHTTFQPLSFL